MIWIDAPNSGSAAMRRERYQTAAFLVTIVPFLGLLLVFAAARARVRRMRVLRGVITTGTVTDRVDDKGTMRLRYEFAVSAACGTGAEVPSLRRASE
jgi:hypothetical protein